LRGSQTTDGHPQQSDPLAEQAYLLSVINRLQELPQWQNTAVFITWDDSDGWYDHVMPSIVNHSQDPLHDALHGGSCGTNPPLGGSQDRCGYGPPHSVAHYFALREEELRRITALVTKAR
jgi:phospholipase C